VKKVFSDHRIWITILKYIPAKNLSNVKLVIKDLPQIAIWISILKYILEKDLSSVKLVKKRFFRKSHLNNHIKRIHIGEKPFKCQTRTDLKKHMRTHTWEDQWCKICSKTYLTKANMKKHMKSHAYWSNWSEPLENWWKRGDISYQIEYNS